MNNSKLNRLSDLLNELVDGGDDIRALIEENKRLSSRVTELEGAVTFLEGVLEDTGIDPYENRLWRLTAISQFVETLGI